MESSESSWNFKHPLTIAFFIIITAVVLYLLFHLLHVFLLIFAGILLAVFLDGLAGLLQKHIHVSRGLALTLVIIGLFLLLGGVGWFAGPRIMEQFALLWGKAPKALNSLEAGLNKFEWGRKILSTLSTPGSILPLSPGLLGGITGFFSTLLGFLTGILIIFFIGIYLSTNPGLYMRNVVHLFSAEKQERISEVLLSLGQALRWWLVGRFSSMTLVGIFTILGLYIAGIPLALTLGFIAAAFSFVPYVGPILSAVPAGMVALAESPRKLLYVIIVYLIVHLFEGYMITPLIQKRAVFLPPALLLTVQILMGVIAGALGVVLATPLAVAVIVVIQMLYVEDVLGGDVRVLGRHGNPHPFRKRGK